MKTTTIAIVALLLVTSCISKDKKEVLVENNAMSQELFTPEGLGYDLYWEDQFEGNMLDSAKWALRQLGPRRNAYNVAEMVEVKDGFLNMMYDIKGDSIMVSAIGSQGLFETTYGYFECRARMPHSIGPWAAFWLQSPLIHDGEDPAKFGTEIDIFEYFKKYGDDVTTHAYHWAYGPNQKGVGPLKSELKGLSKGFHTYALEWTPEKYIFYVDGLKFHEVKEAISHIDEYMIVSFEPTATLEDMKKACAPDTFVVDYVKVYKKKQ